MNKYNQWAPNILTTLLAIMAITGIFVAGRLSTQHDYLESQLRMVEVECHDALLGADPGAPDGTLVAKEAPQ